MTVALVVVGDGRTHYLEQCLASLAAHARYPFALQRIVDDSGHGDPAIYPPGWQLAVHETRRGLAGAVQTAWSRLPDEIDYVFHMEEDFILVAPLDIDHMITILKDTPRLAQLVLKRQPWSTEERVAGGIIEMNPETYHQRDGWVEHSRIFSLNPCLIPRAIIDGGWSVGNEAEMTSRLVVSGWSFGFLGDRDDPPRCIHIGLERSAGWSP